MTDFMIRVEYPNRTFTDVVIDAMSTVGARRRFADDDPDGELAPYDWRGQVVFVRGARPAEEIKRP